MASNSWNGYEQNLLFTNLGDGKFSDVARPLGCDEIEESRGVAIADLNADGRLDIVINNNAAAPTIYLNDISANGNFFRCLLVGGEKSNRDAIGARVEADIIVDGNRQLLTRVVEAGSGYAAQSEPTLHFGLGAAVAIEELRITWPSGSKQTIARNELEGLINSECVIDEGKGLIPTASE